MSAAAVTEQDYLACKEIAVQALVALLETGEAVGRPPELMMGEFMAAFGQAAERATVKKTA